MHPVTLVGPRRQLTRQGICLGGAGIEPGPPVAAGGDSPWTNGFHWSWPLSQNESFYLKITAPLPRDHSYTPEFIPLS